MTVTGVHDLPAIQIAEICRRYQVKELCLFGSAAVARCSHQATSISSSIFSRMRVPGFSVCPR